jgi:hypothetical protein
MKIGMGIFLIAVSCGLWLAMRPADSVSKEAPVSLHVRKREASIDPAFWKSAKVPEPENFRQPMGVEFSHELVAVDYPSRIQHLQSEGDFEALNFAIADWFRSDADAACHWLNERESLDPYESALVEISRYLARAGEVALALEWAELLPAGQKKDQSLYDIYAFAARSRQIDPDKLRAAPLPPEEIEKLLRGIADD